MSSNLDPIVQLVSWSKANMIIYAIGIGLQLLLIAVFPLVRDFHDSIAKSICDKRVKMALEKNDKQLAELWRWKNAEQSPVIGAVLTGFVERFFFALAAYFWMPGFTIAAVAWIALKMIPGWTAASSAAGGNGEPKQVAFSRLRTSFVSLSAAIFIGVGCRAAVLSIV